MDFLGIEIMYQLLSFETFALFYLSPNFGSLVVLFYYFRFLGNLKVNSEVFNNKINIVKSKMVFKRVFLFCVEWH